MKTSIAKLLPVGATLACLTMTGQTYGFSEYLVALRDTGTNVQTGINCSPGDVASYEDYWYAGPAQATYAPCNYLGCIWNNGFNTAYVRGDINTEYADGVYYIGYFFGSSTDWYVRISD